MSGSVVQRVDDDLRAIARSIVERDLSAVEWAGRESDDEFERGAYVGGYDADERAFCFAVVVDGKELWFQLDIEQISSIAAGTTATFDARPAE